MFRRMNDRIKNNICLSYSLLFFFMCLIIYSYYYLNGRTLIFSGDAWYQHFKALVYYSGYLRSIFRTLFQEHRLKIPLWDFSIGEGSDIISALHYYCIGDPISFFSVFFTEETLYLFFDLSIILRMYLCGLIFIKLCRYTNTKNDSAILAASMIYVFCYWNLLNSVKHIFFLNPMMYLPLVILGVEKIICDEKPYLMTAAVALSALSNFYFFYMIVILTVLYVGIRLLVLYGKDIRMIVKKISVIFFASLLGFLLSSVISFPFMYAMLTNNRLGVEYGFHWIYPFFYYDRLITIFLTTDNYFWLCMGFASPVVLSELLIFKQPKKHTTVFILNLLTLIMILFPVFGKLLNGFSYMSNRWSFAIALLVAYTFVLEWDEFGKEKKYLFITLIVFSLAAFVTAWWRQVKIVPIALCFVFLLLVSLNEKILNKTRKQILMIAVILLSILYTADYSNSIRGRNRASGAISVADAENVAKNTDAYVFKEYISGKNVDPFIRYSGSDLMENTAMLNDVFSTNYYFSIANPNVSDFRSKVGINEYPVHWYDGYDDRCFLYTLANVAYYITPAEYEGYLPYGFEFEADLDGYKLYKNNFLLPFGYTYDSYISYDDWDKLSQIEKEEVLLQGVVLERDEGSSPEMKTEKIGYEISADEKLFEVDDHSIFVKEGGSSLLISFDGREGCEHFISFDDLDYDAEEEYFFGDEMTQAVMKITGSDGHQNQIEYHTKDYQFYNGKHDFSAYLGNNDLDFVEITFTREGRYSFDELYISCLPLEGYGEAVDRLRKDHLNDVQIKTNALAGRITLSSDKILLLSIPYSEGWKAFVDGEEAELLKANGCYSALDLKAGSHEIDLVYRTPLLSTGVFVSAASACILILWMQRSRKKSGKLYEK